jgi:hypothetical protein
MRSSVLVVGLFILIAIVITLFGSPHVDEPKAFVFDQNRLRVFAFPNELQESDRVMRDCPSDDCSAVGFSYKGQLIDATYSHDDNEWWRLQSENGIDVAGWIRAPHAIQIETREFVDNDKVPDSNHVTESECNMNYSGCLKPNATDYDCAGGSGNGPYYTGRVQVLGYDEYGLDKDGDGWGCE